MGTPLFVYMHRSQWAQLLVPPLLADNDPDVHRSWLCSGSISRQFDIDLLGHRFWTTLFLMDTALCVNCSCCSLLLVDTILVYIVSGCSRSTTPFLDRYHSWQISFLLDTTLGGHRSLWIPLLVDTALVVNIILGKNCSCCTLLLNYSAFCGHCSL